MHSCILSLSLSLSLYPFGLPDPSIHHGFNSLAAKKQMKFQSINYTPKQKKERKKEEDGYENRSKKPKNSQSMKLLGSTVYMQYLDSWCVYIHMYVYTYTYTYTYTYIHTHIHTHIRTHKYTLCIYMVPDSQANMMMDPPSFIHVCMYAWNGEPWINRKIRRCDAYMHTYIRRIHLLYI